MQHPFARLRPASAALPFLLWLYAWPVAAQIEVARQVMASGGATMGSANFGVSGTTGQPGTGRLQGGDYSAGTGFWFVETSTATGIGTDLLPAPQAFALGQNHPNPFNPTTTIAFTLPRESRTTLRVFDVAGRLVGEIVNEVRPAGTYREQFVARSLASGMYFYRMEADGFLQTRKLLLLK